MVKKPKSKKRRNAAYDEETISNNESNNSIQSAKHEARGVIENLNTLEGFKSSWESFQHIFKSCMDAIGEFNNLLNSRKEKIGKFKDSILENMVDIIPMIKKELGVQGSKNKICYILATNLEHLEGSSLSTVRRIVDLFEEKYGKIYPKELEEKNKSIGISSVGNVIKITEKDFEGGPEAMESFFDDVHESIAKGKFRELDIYINAKATKIKNIILQKGNGAGDESVSVDINDESD